MTFEGPVIVLGHGVIPGQFRSGSDRAHRRNPNPVRDSTIRVAAVVGVARKTRGIPGFAFANLNAVIAEEQRREVGQRERRRPPLILRPVEGHQLLSRSHRLRGNQSQAPVRSQDQAHLGAILMGPVNGGLHWLFKRRSATHALPEDENGPLENQIYGKK